MLSSGCGLLLGSGDAPPRVRDAGAGADAGPSDATPPADASDGGGADLDAAVSLCPLAREIMLEDFGGIASTKFLGDTSGSENVGSGSCACPAAPSPDNVYTWVAPADGRIEIDTFGDQTAYDTILHVRSDCDDPTTELACDDDSDGVFTSPEMWNRSSVTRDVVAGERLFIIVDGCNGARGTYELSMRFAPFPLSGTCESPVPLDLEIAAGGTLSMTHNNEFAFGVTESASAECVCSGDRDWRWEPGHEVVYRMTVTTPGCYRASTEDPTTVIDTVLYVRSTCGDPGSELACNDDIVLSEYPSRIEFQAAAGVPLYLFVDACRARMRGNYRLTIAHVGETCR